MTEHMPQITYRFVGRLARRLKFLVKIADFFGYKFFNHNKPFPQITDIKSVGIILPSGIGDFFNALPMLYTIKALTPLRLTVAVPPPLVSIAKACSFIDEVKPFAVPFLKFRSPNVSYSSLIQQIQNMDVDLLIETRGDIRLSFLLWWAKKQQIISGFSIGGGGFFFHHLISGYKPLEQHSSHIYHRVLASLGLPEHPLSHWRPEYFPSSDIPNSLPDRYIAIHTGTGWQSKEWPKQYFVDLAKQLQNKISLVFIGTHDDLTSTQKEELKLPFVHCLLGSLNILQTAHVIRHAQLYIGQDTGFTHAAALLGIPYIALYSAIDFPSKYTPLYLTPNQGVVIQRRPYCSGVAGCFKRTCADNICMKHISVDEVVEKALSMIKNRDNHPVESEKNFGYQLYA